MSTTELNQSFPSYDLLSRLFPYYEQLRDVAPVQHLPERNEYLVSRHEDVQYALRNTDIFSTALVETPSLDYEDGRPLLNVDPPDHTAVRALASPPFTPRRLREITPLIQSHVDHLIDTFIDRGEVDFVEDFAFQLPIRIICDLMALPLEGPEFDAITVWSRVDRSNTEYFPESGDFNDKKAEIQRIADNMIEYIADIVRQRAEEPGDDLISEMIQRQIAEDGELAVGSMTSISAELLAGGVTTTAHMMASAMMLLIGHPEWLAKTIADPSLIPPLFEETLRLEAPVQWRARVTKQDVELSGVKIPKGARVLLLFASGSRDEEAFEDAKTFCPARPHRELKRHFGFGYGQHFCLGAPLARIEATLAFESFFERTKNIQTVDELNDFDPIEHLHFRAPRKVYLRFEKA
jgi:cytochrome P450